jgi:hypothetical protein
MRMEALVACVFLLISATTVGAATYKTLHSFDYPGSGDVYWPYPGVIFDQAGNLYGIASYGGGTTKTERFLSCLLPRAAGRTTLCTNLKSIILPGENRWVAW